MESTSKQIQFRATPSQLEMLLAVAKRIGTPGNESAAVRFILEDWKRLSGYAEKAKEPQP